MLFYQRSFAQETVVTIYSCESSKAARYFIAIKTVRKFQKNGVKKLSS